MDIFKEHTLIKKDYDLFISLLKTFYEKGFITEKERKFLREQADERYNKWSIDNIDCFYDRIKVIESSKKKRKG